MDFLVIKKELSRIADTLFAKDKTFLAFPYDDENGELKFFNKISDLELFIRLGEISEDTREYLKVWLQIYRRFPQRFRSKILVETEKETKAKELFRREDLLIKLSEFNKFKNFLTKDRN